MTPVAVVAFLAAAAAAAPGPEPEALRKTIRAYRAAHEAAILDEFFEILRVPNLASDAVNIRANAELIRKKLEGRGVTTRLLESPGAPPVVYGELLTPGARRTIVVYAHYDGQPVDPARWSGAPWTPVLRDRPLEDGGHEVAFSSLPAATRNEARLYARSSSDDKAPIIGFLTALDALRAAKVAPSVNVKFFFEGEEEAGSPHLETILVDNAALLKADAWILCDGPVHQTRRPQVYFGARGVVGVEMTLYGPAHVLHSGHYGNWAPNPAALLANLLAGMRDADGRILIDGFYDDVRPPTEAERRALAEVPDVDDDLRHELALGATEAGNARLVDRLMLPALNVRGLEAGRVGAAAANAIPTEARASIDFRLVPSETPEKVRALVEAHLTRQGYFIVRDAPSVEVRRDHPRVIQLDWSAGYPPSRTVMDTPISRALVQVVQEAAGAPVVVMPTLGGSIPMYLFDERLKTPVVGLPTVNHDNNQHAANENLRLQNLWDGIDVYAFLLARLGYRLN